MRYPTDVQAAIVFSSLTGVRLSVKNKGHDYKGRSSGKDTLALWVSSIPCNCFYCIILTVFLGIELELGAFPLRALVHVTLLDSRPDQSPRVLHTGRMHGDL